MTASFAKVFERKKVVADLFFLHVRSFTNNKQYMMKRNFLFLVLGLFAITMVAQAKVKDHVEVMYFHGKQRCVTCMAKP